MKIKFNLIYKSKKYKCKKFSNVDTFLTIRYVWNVDKSLQKKKENFAKLMKTI